MTQTASAPVHYMSCADTAKLVRQALRAAFPAVKFSVKSHVYSGGASINVRWTNGPLRQAVEAVAKTYEGARFDGMEDLKVRDTHWLRPDGSVLVHYAAPTAIYRGEDNRDLAPVIPADAKLVRFGADFIFCDRELADRTGWMAEAETFVRGRCVLEGLPGNERFGGQWLSDMIAAMAYQHLDGETWEETFKRLYRC